VWQPPQVAPPFNLLCAQQVFSLVIWCLLMPIRSPLCQVRFTIQVASLFWLKLTIIITLISQTLRPKPKAAKHAFYCCHICVVILVIWMPLWLSLINMTSLWLKIAPIRWGHVIMGCALAILVMSLLFQHRLTNILILAKGGF